MNNLGVVVVVDLKDAGQELSAFEVFTLVYLGGSVLQKLNHFTIII